jgi:hypothetical protein
MVHMKENGRAAVVIDDRYAPILVSSFFGTTDVPLGQWYEARHAQLATEQFRLGRRTVNISDATYSSVPDAQMRHFWAGMAERHAATLQGMTLVDSVVVTNAWARGALTAVGWLSPRISALKIYPSLEVALQAGLSSLEAASLPLPAYPGVYRLPHEATGLAIVQGALRERAVKSGA